jgi:heme/copper-type cytochrome/quinol oxidase subunit 1
MVVALGFAIYLFGQWLLETIEFGSRANFGWVAYAPLSNSFSSPVRLLHPWVILLFWLILLAVWTMASLMILQRRRDETPS